MTFHLSSSASPLLAGALAAFLIGAVAVPTQVLAQDDAAPQTNGAQAPETKATDTKAAGMATADPVVATVNGKPITRRDLELALQDIGDSIPEMSEAERHEYLVTYLTDLILVAKAARDKKMDSDPDFRRRMDYLVNRNLMEAYLNAEGIEAASAEAARKLYDEVIKDIPEEARIRARHILVESEEEAKDIKTQLDEGADFAAIAREKSKDPGSGKEGGDLGWFTKEEMVPEFAEAAFALEPGQVSEPVKSDFGWHIIKTEGKRDKPGFDEVESELYEMVARQRQRDIILSLRQNAEIEMLGKKSDGGADAGHGKKGGKKAKAGKHDEAGPAAAEPAAAEPAE